MNERGPHSELILRTFLPDGRMDRRATLALLDADVEWDMSRSPFPDARVYRGVAGVSEWFGGLEDAFGEVLYEVERVREANDQVAMLVRVRGRGPSSGIPVDYRFAPLLTFRAGKVLRMVRYEEWEQALAAMSTRGSR